MANITANDDEDQPVTVTLPDLTGKGRDEFQILPPTPEQLILLATADNSAVAIMTLLEQSFEPEQYAEIRRRLGLGRKDPARLKIDDLTTLVEQLVEARSGGFPTESSSASSPSPTPIGKRSTGRVHSPASTPSGSASVAS